MNDTRFLRLPPLCVVAGILLTLLPVVMAQEEGMDPELKTELTYIRMLQQMRMPDIAEQVIDEAKRRFPEAAAQFKVQELQGLLWQGKFDDVQKIIDAMPDKNGAEYWALKLAKADALYAFQKYAEADKLYLEFFSKIKKPTPALKSFYRDSAYKYAQMLLYLGKQREALDAYRRLVDNVELEEGRKRNVQAEMAELMLKLAPSIKNGKEKSQMLAEAEKLVDDLLWKQDVWFGKAIVMKAHLAMIRNDVSGAQELVENYMPQLKIIHDSLTDEDPDGSRGWLRMSPMPQCRYLLAELLLEEAKAEIKKAQPDEERIKSLFLGERDPKTKQRAGNGAFNHFINVFIRFPESQWAAAAGERSEEIRDIIKDRYDVALRTPVTEEQMRKVREMQFAGANLLFSQNQYKKAIDRYLVVLNQFPEKRESVNALHNLAVCYIDGASKSADDQMMADTVVGHISERFCENDKMMRLAGDKLRQIGELYGELKRDDKKRQVYAMFFRDYPEHYAASQLIMSFGEREFKSENFEGALHYYQRIRNEYPKSTYYIDALNRITQVHKAQGNDTNEIGSIEFLISELHKRKQPGHNLPVAMFRLAEAQRELGNKLMKQVSTNENAEAVRKKSALYLTQAAVGFGNVVQLLSGDDAGKYYQNAEEKERNENMREMAAFTKGVALVQMQFPKEKVETFRKLAIQAFEGYLKEYPESKYSARAQMQIATIYTVLAGTADAETDKTEFTGKSQQAFETLAARYPHSEEAKNSVPQLAKYLMEMGLRGEGIAKYREMFTADGRYSPNEYNAAGQALLEADEYPLALQAFNKVLDSVKDDQVAAKANAMLGKVKALMGQKKFANARKILADFINDPKLSSTLMVVEANLLLVEAASEEGKTEADNDRRRDLFNQAVDALKFVKAWYAREGAETNKKKIAEIELSTGDLMVRKMEAERNLKLDEQMAETRGKAIVAYMTIIDRFDPGDADLAPLLEKAYFTFIPLLLEHKQFEQVVEDGQNYLKIFPEGRYRTRIETWINQAKIEL